MWICVVSFADFFIFLQKISDCAMKNLIFPWLLMLNISLFAKTRQVTLYWVHSSDVHSSIFGYDYLKNRPMKGGLSSIYAYVTDLRQRYPDQVVCTDGGDCLQGQPLAYYYNFIRTDSPHLITEAMNAMHYDCSVMGNHDIETGHEVYDRWKRELNCPLLGANVIDESTGKPYLQPYTVIERSGVKIAILGLITPAIPSWLPRNLWEGLRFEDMVESARKWVPKIMKKEHPQLLVGVFHSGVDGGIVTDEYIENGSRMVAEQVPGFDLIMYGHDHMYAVNQYQRPGGDSILVIGPTSMGARVAEAQITLKLRGKKVIEKKIEGRTPLMTASETPAAKQFEEKLRPLKEEMEEWMDETIGAIDTTIMERDAYFGPCLFIDLIHQIQLELTGAQVSFAAPLSYDSRLRCGPLTIRDMFKLYKYENFLYKMRMTGREIKGFLELDYARWTNRMTSPQDHVLLLDNNMDDGKRFGLKNFAFNFDSAAGIVYTVDVTKPEGEKIHISSLADGTPFEMDQWYTVALNSYRGNGGGELMTRGAGIPHEQLSSRIIESSDKDLRYYMIQMVRSMGTLHPRKLSQWRFVPEEWTREALKKDRKLLFPK